MSNPSKDRTDDCNNAATQYGTNAAATTAPGCDAKITNQDKVALANVILTLKDEAAIQAGSRGGHPQRK